MNMNDFVRVQTKLVAEDKLSFPYAAILTDMALNRFDERVREGVMLWLEDKLTEDFEVDGVTVCEILDEVNGSMFQTLCIMDMLLKNPESAKCAIWSFVEDVIYG